MFYLCNVAVFLLVSLAPFTIKIQFLKAPSESIKPHEKKEELKSKGVANERKAYCLLFLFL